MCGLAGLVDSSGVSVEALAERATRMADMLAHRGPDDEAVWCDPNTGVALAHRRLSIIDLSDMGRQPMISADGRFVLVFNGEIYNFGTLSDRLTKRGIGLRGHSDTEVLLETIASSTLADALDQATGQFALALWDRDRQELSLARDRLGEKPLYYVATGGDFLFASEVGAIRRDAAFSPSIDEASVALLLRHSFIPGPRSIYRGVMKLAPGHVVTYRPADRRLSEPTPFWSLEEVAREGRANRLPQSDGEIVEEAEALLKESVRGQMIADVPLGAFLSGGIDSSLVVALMSAVSSRQVRTFTVSVGGEYDEASYAARVARHLGTDHTEIELSEADALDLARRVPTLYDEPFADPSALPMAMMCAAARRHVTVCLSGDGGDEVLAGYNRYLAAGRLTSTVQRLPAGPRSSLAGLITSVPPRRLEAMMHVTGFGRRFPDVGTKIHKLCRVIEASDPRAAYLALTEIVDPTELLTSSQSSAFSDGPPPWPTGLDPLHAMLYLDTMCGLPDDMLVKVDRASMASSLECRVPLLDHRFVEYAWRLPKSAKVRHGKGKWLLRQVLARHVPTEYFDRPKRGFDPPIGEWLRGPLRAWMCDLLSESRLRRQGLLDPRNVGLLMAEHLEGRRNHDYALWTLAVLQSWLDAHEMEVIPA